MSDDDNEEIPEDARYYSPLFYLKFDVRLARGLTILDVERVVETPAQRRPFIPQPVYSRTYLGPGGSQDVMPMWFREVENLGRLVHKPEKSAGIKWNEYDPE